MKDQTPMRQLMTFEELCEVTQTAESTMRNMLTSGTGPTAIKIGRNLRFRPDDVDAWLDSLVGKRGKR